MFMFICVLQMTVIIRPVGSVTLNSSHPVLCGITLYL